MEYIPYQKKSQGDDVNYNSSSSQSSRGEDLRKIKKSQKSSKRSEVQNKLSKSRKSQDDHSSERYKQIVQNNTRKNNEIWLKNSHAIKLPNKNSTSSSIQRELRDIQKDINPTSPANDVRLLTNSEVFERSGSQRELNSQKFELKESPRKIKYDA